MKIKFLDVNPTLIENTTMQMTVDEDANNRIIGYQITPISGYVLRDNAGDWVTTAPNTMEQTTKQAYYRGTCTCMANYDFVANPREFLGVPENSVPSDQIFGGVEA